MVVEAANLLIANTDNLARLFTREQGRSVDGAKQEIEGAGAWMKAVAGITPPVLVSEDSATQFIETRYVPLGVICAIAPWNFPVALAMWKLAPALVAGNTLVLKPSPFTPLCTLKIGELFRDVFPRGVLNIISGGDDLGPMMTSHAGFAKIAFTGSTATGKRVMASAAKDLKRVTLELGGNDAAIVLPDVDLDAVAQKIFFGAFYNSSQICTATKRLYVHEDIYDGLRDRLAAQLPARLVCEMMGVPEEDRAKVRETVARFGAPEDPHFQIDGGVHKTFTAMLDKIYKYMLELALKRRLDPQDDFTSLAASLVANGELLDDRMLGFWCMGFVVGGLETTRDALSIGFYEFMQNPAQARLLRGDPSLAPRAADEMIRWASPSKYKWRIATRDVEVGGKRICKGDWVVNWLVSANRDEAVFDHADQFDVSRNPNPHLSFGAGDHSCIGRHLARLEIQMMINAVVQYMPDMKISGEHEWIVSTNHSGLRMLPVIFTPSELAA